MGEKELYQERLSDKKLSRRDFIRISLSEIGILAGISACDKNSDKKDEHSSLNEIVIPLEMKERAGKALENSYDEFRKMYVIHEDGGYARVLYDTDKKTSAAELNAYAMIFACALEDKNTFEEMYNYTEKYRKKDTGLVSWLVDANGIVEDSSSASDSDEDIAFSLLVADRLWGGYSDTARNYIENMMRHDVEDTTFVLKGGDTWGGSNLTNPSYYDPHYYEVFKQFDPRWEKVADTCRLIMDKVDKRIQNKEQVYFPDWVDSEGNPAPNPDGSPPRIHYDTTRIPIRQLRAALFLKDFDSKSAFDQMRISNSFYQEIIVDGNEMDINFLKDSYSLHGEEIGIYTRTAWTAAATVAALVSEDKKYKEYMFEELIRLPTQQPFNMSIKMLALLSYSYYMDRLNIEN